MIALLLTMVPKQNNGQRISVVVVRESHPETQGNAKETPASSSLCTSRRHTKPTGLVKGDARKEMYTEGNMATFQHRIPYPGLCKPRCNDIEQIPNFWRRPNMNENFCMHIHQYTPDIIQINPDRVMPTRMQTPWYFAMLSRTEGLEPWNW